MKKVLSIILTILMIVTTIPMVALPASAALTPTATGGCNGNHSGYTQIQLNGGTTHRITKAGNYYINSSIYESTYSPALEIECSGTVTICLNGYDICHTGYGSRVIYLSSNGGELTINLCDCKGTGEIYHEDGNTGIDFAPGVITLNMYGGTIRDCDSGLSTWSNCTVNMYGGTIKNCSYYGIFQDSNNGKVNIYGGSIINNNEGIRVCSADSVTLTGSPIISGNTNGDLYYRRPNSAVVAKDLSVSSPITIGQDREAAGDYAVVKVDSADMLGSFKYINNTKQLFYNNNQIFVHGDSHSFKDATCTAPKTCTICGATEGVADNTAHTTWGEGVLTRPTKTEEGYYTYTCSSCGATKTEAAERATNYAEYTNALNNLRAYLDSDKLTDDAKASVAEWLEIYDSDEAYKFIAGEEETVNLYIEAALYYATEIEAAIQDCLAGNHSGNGEYCDICGAALHTCDFSGEWKYDSEKHWKECSCGEISEEIAHTYLDGECECGFVCSHTDITVYGWDYCYTCGYIVAEEIALDTPHTVTERHFVKFTPEVSGSYYFRSYDTTDGADPEGYVYEGNIFNYLDFIGSNKNFLYGNPAYNEITFEAELTAGKTYYFELYEYRKTQNGEPFEYTVMIKKICDNGAHSFTDSICDVCGYECFHPVATEGVCDNCGSACTHNKQDKEITVRPVQNDDGTWEKGTVEITCLVCGNTETQEVERDHEGYKTFDETAAKLEALINSDELIDSPKNSFTASLNNLKNSAYSQVYTEIEGAIPSMTDSLNSIIATIEAGLANGTMKKADWTYMTAILDEIKALIDNDPNKIIPSMVGYYYGPNGFYSGSFGNPDYPQSDYDRVMAEYGFKNQLETLLAGLKDGSALKADYTEIDEAIAEIEQKLADENVTDEAKAELEEIKADLEEMKQNPISSEADLAELEKALEDYEAELDAGIADGSAVKVDANKIMTEIVNEWVAELQAKDLMDDYEAFNADKKATEEAIAKEKEIIELAYSLEGSVADNAENIAKVEEALREFLADFTKCLEGTHCVKEYAVIEEAKCGENAVEEGTCWFCGEVLTREVENSALTHSFTKYEVTEEAKCGVEGKEVAYCDHGCGETDEKAIEALRHSFTKYEVTEEAKCGVAGKETAYCDHGCGETDEKEIEALRHSFVDYVYNEDATCEANGTKTAVCANGCGETDTVEAEDTMLEHADEDGDGICDDCESEIKEVCPDCGGPVHESEISEYICVLVSLIKLLVSLIRFLAK